MNETVARLQGTLLTPRAIRAMVWFVTLGALLYLAVVFWLGWGETVAAFTTLGLESLALGMLASSLSYLLRFGRWQVTIERLGYALPRLMHFGIYLSGLALTATPGKAGETFRSALLLRYGVKLAHSLSAFLVDRGSDVLGMILLGALAAAVLDEHRLVPWALSFASVLLASLVLANLALRPAKFVLWQRAHGALSWLPLSGGMATLRAWASAWTLPRVLVFSGVAVLAYGSQALVFAWFCRLLGTGVGVADSVMMFVQATLFGAASLVPGGLGVMEAALVYQLLDHNVSEAIAVSLAISIRLVTLWFGMSLGLLSLVFLSLQRGKLTPEQ